MQSEIRDKILREIDSLGDHVKNRTITCDEVTLYLGLLKEARNFMDPSEVQTLLAARQNMQVRQHV